MNTNTIAYGSFALLCAVISAKWALDLGYSQTRQLVCGIAGLFLGPLMLLILYVRFVYQAKRQGKSSGELI